MHVCLHTCSALAVVCLLRRDHWPNRLITVCRGNTQLSPMCPTQSCSKTFSLLKQVLSAYLYSDKLSAHHNINCNRMSNQLNYQIVMLAIDLFFFCSASSSIYTNGQNKLISDKSFPTCPFNRFLSNYWLLWSREVYHWSKFN